MKHEEESRKKYNSLLEIDEQLQHLNKQLQAAYAAERADVVAAINRALDARLDMMEDES